MSCDRGNYYVTDYSEKKNLNATSSERLEESDMWEECGEEKKCVSMCVRRRDGDNR